jgi:hypothetical protein
VAALGTAAAGTVGDAGPGGGGDGDGAPDGAHRLGLRARVRSWWPLVLVLVPLAVSAVALVAFVGADYVPTGDHAGTEIAVRALGHHEVLTGLWSRDNWGHPGPMSFYVFAPFYWLTGGSSVGLSVGALAVNGASIAAMAVVARRRGGTALLLCTLVACALVVRTLGADNVHDFQNVVIVTLPFGALLFLAWAMTCGEAWALPAGALFASFLAQTHVGFLPLALPLLMFGAVWLAVSVLRSDGPDRRGERRALRTASLATGGLLALVWAPPVVDVLMHSPNNGRRILEWFKAGDGGVHGPGDGWAVVTGQFGVPPEWLISKRPTAWLGESGFLDDPLLPVLLVPLVAAAVVLWRRRPDGRSLVAVLAVALVLAIVAVMRTVGPVFDYRLRWTWMPPLLAFVLVTWTAWLLAVDRWGRRADRALTAAAIAVLVAVSGVNVVTAATAGTPHPDDSAMVAALLPDVLDHLDPDGGAVTVSDPFTSGSWYGRALALQLERRGFDVRVPPDKAIEFTAHHGARPGRVQAHLLVLGDALIDRVGDDSELRRIAHSLPERSRVIARNARATERILADAKDRGVTPAEALADPEIHDAVAAAAEPVPEAEGQTYALELAVFIDEDPEAAPDRADG